MKAFFVEPFLISIEGIRYIIKHFECIFKIIFRLCLIPFLLFILNNISMDCSCNPVYMSLSKESLKIIKIFFTSLICFVSSLSGVIGVLVFQSGRTSIYYYFSSIKNKEKKTVIYLILLFIFYLYYSYIYNLDIDLLVFFFYVIFIGFIMDFMIIESILHENIYISLSKNKLLLPLYVFQYAIIKYFSLIITSLFVLIIMGLALAIPVGILYLFASREYFILFFDPEVFPGNIILYSLLSIFVIFVFNYIMIPVVLLYKKIKIENP